MKNNIKYAGIAAAALLAVAPIAAPVVNSTNAQTVQAATGDLNAAQQASLNKFLAESSLRSTTTANTSADFPNFDQVSDNLDQKNLTYDQLIAFDPIAKATNYNISANDVKNINDAKVTFGVQGIVNGQVANKNDFDLATGTAKSNGGTVTIRVTAYDANGNQINNAQKDLNFVNKNSVTDSITSINVNYTNPYEVAVNSSTTAPQYTTTVDATATDQKGNNIKTSNPQPANKIYTTAAAALGNDASKEYKSNSFDQVGKTYYQAVTITLDPSADVQSIYTSMQNGQGGQITLNGQQAVKANVNANTITYVREIKVGDGSTTPDNGTWKETSSVGVVTVNGSIAHLYDDDNTLTSRSLAPNSGWQTDKYRTNSKTGQVQYHVSTHEWVNASDVSFSGNGGGTVTGDGLGNFKDFPEMHVVNLAGPSGFVYTLFTAEGKTASRGLAGNTAWQCDRTATDKNGTTYYRVSTDEWVRQGTGVTFN